MTLHIPPAWAELAERLGNASWRRIVVLGGGDVGKSTFCRFVGADLAQRGFSVGLLDTDLGQKLIGPPTCITLGRMSATDEVHLERIRFIGEVTPAANIAGVVAASARLAAQTDCDRLIANTSGLIAGPGVTLKRWKLEALDPDHVVTIARGSELARLVCAVPPERVHRLLPSPAAQRKSLPVRERNRLSGLRAALGGCRPVSLPHAVVEDLHRNPPEPNCWRLCGLADAAGEDRGIGLSRGSDLIERAEVWTSLDPTTLHRVRLGMVSPPLGELHENLGPN